MKASPNSIEHGAHDSKVIYSSAKNTHIKKIQVAFDESINQMQLIKIIQMHSETHFVFILVYANGKRFF